MTTHCLSSRNLRSVSRPVRGLSSCAIRTTPRATLDFGYDYLLTKHKDFVKAIISMEKGINDESALDKLYDAYIDNDTVNLLHEEFDYMIEHRLCRHPAQQDPQRWLPQPSLPKVGEELGEVRGRWRRLGLAEPVVRPYGPEESSRCFVTWEKTAPCPREYPRRAGTASMKGWWL